MLKKYYNQYWEKRLLGGNTAPIPDFLPDFLKKYTSYGAILNQITATENLLDIGCGDGGVTALYKTKATNVYGLDISKTALEVAEKKGIIAKEHDLNQLPLPFGNDFFDYVIMTDVVEHVIDPLGLLKEVKRILKPGGKVIITVPNFARWGNRLRMAFYGDPVDILHWSKYGDEVEHLHWFTLPKLKHLLAEADLSLLKCAPTGLKDGSMFLGLLHLFNFGNYMTLVAKNENQ